MSTPKDQRNAAEIYDDPLKNMTTAGVFGYAGVDVIPLQEKCDRCGQAITVGLDGFKYCSPICSEHGQWSSTRKSYPIISIEHLLTRAVYYIGEARNNRAGGALNVRA